MISKRSEFQVVCDFCNNSTDWATAESEFQAGKLFYENGWRYIEDKHKCPDCIRQHNALQKGDEE